jgi:hypothetical protein
MLLKDILKFRYYSSNTDCKLAHQNHKADFTVYSKENLRKIAPGPSPEIRGPDAKYKMGP